MMESGGASPRGVRERLGAPAREGGRERHAGHRGALAARAGPAAAHDRRG